MQVFLEAYRVREWQQKQINRGQEKGRLKKWVAEDREGARRPDKTIGLLKTTEALEFLGKNAI